MKESAAVIGHPISHSLSPVIFGFLARALGKTDFDYQALDIAPESLKLFFDSARERPGFSGFNATLPHKEKLLHLVDHMTTTARAIGAINMVSLHEGIATGHNTDIKGLQESFQDFAIELRDQNVIVIGAGGAARATAFAAATAGAKNILLCNRNSERAEKVVHDIGHLFPETKWITGDFNQKLEDAKLIVNATPVGMQGQQTTIEELAALRNILSGYKNSKLQNRFAFDLIYYPQSTPFLLEAKKLGFQTVSGLTMLIAQAIATWEIWFEEIEPKTKNELKINLSRRLRDVLSEKR